MVIRTMLIVSLLTVSLGGCRWIAGYDKASAAADDAKGPPIDLALAEAGPEIDGGSVPPPDLYLGDGLSPEERASCAVPNPSQADDGDLLLGDRDPDPTRCNRRIYDSLEGIPWEFRQLRNNGWVADNACMQRTPTGVEQMSCTNNDGTEYFARLTNLPVESDVDGYDPANYLVEATVQLGELATDTFTDVSVLARFDFPSPGATDPYNYLSCGIYDDPATYWNPGRPDMRIEVRRDSRGGAWQDFENGGWIDAWNPMHTADFSTNAGDRFLIQLLHTPPAIDPSGYDVKCRLLDTQGVLLRLSTFDLWDLASHNGDDYLEYVPPQPASIGLRIANATARFERVQVFELYR